MPHADEPTAPSPDATVSARSRRRIPPFVLVGVLGVIVIGALVVREVASIREGARESDRLLAELERQEAEEEGAYAWDVEWPGDEAVVRLAEVQRQGPETAGRYHLDVGTTRWALDLPPAGADDATWTTWAESSEPRWTALAEALGELTEAGASVRAEIFAPWQAAQEAVPERLLLRLLPILAAAGILDLDVEHAPALLEPEEK